MSNRDTVHGSIFPEDEASLWVDPPGGWRYGFPKIVPRNIKNEDFGDWLVSNHYPQRDVELALKYSRYWKSNGNQD